MWVFVLFFGLYLMITAAVTRVRAELGPPAHDMAGVNPQTALTTVFGIRPFGRGNLVIFSLFSWFNSQNRSQPMPHQLEGFKLAQRTGMDHRKLLWVMLFSIVIGVFSAFLMYLYVLYTHGGSKAGMILGPGWGTYNRLAGWLQVSTTDRCFRIGGHRSVISIYDVSRYYAAQVYLVALPPSWLCNRHQRWNARSILACVNPLFNRQVCDTQIWRSASVPTCIALLPRASFGGCGEWQLLGYFRRNFRDTDVCCVVLDSTVISRRLSDQ